MNHSVTLCPSAPLALVNGPRPCVPSIRSGRRSTLITGIFAWGFLALFIFNVHAELAWKVRLEEPTGIYRRNGEVVHLPLDKLPGQKGHFVVTDPSGKEVPWQVAERALLF